ncbi:asparagine synthase (glutamine-hydrolyzing) [Pontixanthobacter aquaemixtae]|uniref:asparagine synthase (glutamine-hydrolyzing) n=1 Tax=Pontixanthobacter aquaemixtae TaxID=1958940 RepID=A0A844ZW08_9SPHN|nr:asparagine synthase (glutamine-hydrolyzing) [Pontixanthobacter aquaemixtae]MXO91360.1 asparagine synthase (glutamine-hydrolyzing) [Pontixanthobacter aquaemixtae]
MCGIAGFWTRSGSAGGVQLDAELRGETLARMASAIRHRGPDEDGFWQDADIGIGLAHRRLSILDLSEAGSQPMHSPSDRYVIVYNGEIYNHLDLRKRLESEGAAQGWKGHSDTETLLACIDAWGLEATLKAASGMFALALWDKQEGTLSLARDRLGEKPLFYGTSGGAIVFASELKSICAFPQFEHSIDQSAAALFLRYSYVPAPLSIFRNIAKLMPGQIATFGPGSLAPELMSYWTLAETISSTAPARNQKTSLAEAADAVEATLTEVVASQLISDVPIGAFLSGGIDSSLITALMQKVSDKPVKTFSIGFEDERFDEARHAAEVAAHLGTEHREMILTERDILDLAPSITSIYDEPFADSSLLPTTLLSRMAREHVTVSLSGDGGDEMFAGYNRHIHGPKLWSKLERTPGFARKLIGKSASFAERAVTRSPKLTARVTGALKLPVTVPDKLARFGDAFASSDSPIAMYELLLATGARLENAPIQGLIERLSNAVGKQELSLAERFMAWDSLSYLPDDILVKVDRAAMASSLETRAPFLDSRTIEAAWSTNLEHKLGVHGGKTVLREILYRHCPKAIIDRPKQGFAIPLNDWLRHELRDWGQAAIDAYANHAELRPFAATIESAWADHQASKRQHGTLLFNAIVLSDWLSATKRAVGSA